MDFKPFKSFMRGCAKYKNKWTAISPEELYYTLTGESLSSGEVKLVHAFRAKPTFYFGRKKVT